MYKYYQYLKLRVCKNNFKIILEDEDLGSKQYIFRFLLVFDKQKYLYFFWKLGFMINLYIYWKKQKPRWLN